MQRLARMHFAHVECTDLGQSLFDRFAFLIKLLIAQRALSFSSSNRTSITVIALISLPDFVRSGGLRQFQAQLTTTLWADGQVLGSQNHFNCTLTNLGATISARPAASGNDGPGLAAST